jgi:purine nucleosidase/pyrimidine-specific ribonucleoside hydrolase
MVLLTIKIGIRDNGGIDSGNYLEFTMQKIIIDTDPGQDIDDLLAIHFALLRPELDIQAITTVTLPSDRRARMIRRLLRYMDRTDIPVAAGMQFPLRQFRGDEKSSQYDFSHTMNHYAFAEPEDPRDEPGTYDAVDLIIRTVEKNPGEIVICAIAPLTNIACALCKRPDIAGKIKYIAMMGGETVLDRAEHNVAFDYNAADVVLTSGIPIFMGTWDITRRFTLSMDDCNIFRECGSPLYRALGNSIDLWHPAQSWKPGPVMYDIFPIIWSFDRSCYTTSTFPVRVDTMGESTRGKTFIDENGTNIEVTTDINADKVRELYFNTVTL